MKRVCERCRGALPVGTHGNRRFCVECGRERERERQRRLHADRVRETRVACRECGRTLVRSRTKAAGICWECEEKARKAAAAKAAAVAAAAAAEDAQVQAEWRQILRRTAKTKGPEFAAQFATELNKHRRRNNLPEVRL